MRAGGTLRSLMALMLEIAPNIATDSIVGLPKSADTQSWDINAKLPTTGEGAPLSGSGQFRPPPASVALEMLRGMLLDQFELKTHTENREVTVYTLTAAGKLKLVRADESERSGCTAIQPPRRPDITSSCHRRPVGHLRNHVEQVGSDPPRTSGNNVLRDTVRGHDQIQHGGVAVDVQPPIVKCAAKALCEAGRRFADMHIRNLKPRLLRLGRRRRRIGLREDDGRKQQQCEEALQASLLFSTEQPHRWPGYEILDEGPESKVTAYAKRKQTHSDSSNILTLP